jgi:hypothetical protein
LYQVLGSCDRRKTDERTPLKPRTERVPVSAGEESLMDIGVPETEREIEVIPLEEPVPAPAPVDEPVKEPVPA